MEHADETNAKIMGLVKDQVLPMCETAQAGTNMIDRFSHEGLLSQKAKLLFNLVEPPDSGSWIILGDVFGDSEEIFFGLSKSIDSRHGSTARFTSWRPIFDSIRL